MNYYFLLCNQYIFTLQKFFLKSYKKDFNFELILWIDVAVLKNFKGLQIVTTNRLQLRTYCTQRNLPLLLCHNGFLSLWRCSTTAFLKGSKFKCTSGHWNLQSRVRPCKSFIKSQKVHLESTTKPKKLSTFHLST